MANATEQTQDQLADALRRTADAMDGMRLPADGLQPEHDVNVGDRVRSYDFPECIPAYLDPDDERRFARSCFVEGTVVAVEGHPESPCKAYRIEVDRRVFAGKENGVAGREVATPPTNGTPMMMGGVTFGVFQLPDEGLDGLRELSEAAAELRARLDRWSERHGRDEQLDSDARLQLTRATAGAGKADRALVRLLAVY